MIEVLGWAGSALLVISLLQSRMRLLRILNLLASLMLIGYNLALQVWPMVAMNTAVALINIWQLWRLHRAGVAPVRSSVTEPERISRAR